MPHRQSSVTLKQHPLFVCSLGLGLTVPAPLKLEDILIRVTGNSYIQKRMLFMRD